MYTRIPFGLMNAGAKFHRAMDVAFVGDRFAVIYLDDVIVFSGSDDEHLESICRKLLKSAESLVCH